MTEFDKKLREFQDFIARAMRKTGWSETKLAKEAGIRHTLITRRMRGNTTSLPKTETIRAIERVSGVLLIDSRNASRNFNDSDDDSNMTATYGGMVMPSTPSEAGSMKELRAAAVILLSQFPLSEALKILDDAMNAREQKEQALPTIAGRTS